MSVVTVVTLSRLLPGPPAEFTVINNTQTTLRIYEMVGGERRSYGEYDSRPGVADVLLSAGNQRIIPGGVDAHGCTSGELIAIDRDFNVVARHPAGLCDGEAWVIGGVGS